MTAPIRLTVNGASEELDVHPLIPLAHALRDELGLTGTKLACEAGDCGSCSVLLDGVPVAACLVPAAHADGHEVVTVEGLVGEDGGPHAIQVAMRAGNASQCGFCIPGMAVTAAALVDRARRDGAAAPGREELVAQLSGNLCRCTGYSQILESIAAAVDGVEVGR